MLNQLLLVAIFVTLVVPPAFALGYLHIRPQRAFNAAVVATRQYQRQQQKKLLAEKEKREKRQRMVAVAKIGRDLAGKISEAYGELGFRYMPRSWERKGKQRWDRIKINYIMLGEDYVVFRLDHLPARVQPYDLLKDETMENLRIKVGRPFMRIISTDYDGLFLYVPLKDAMQGIPNTFHWRSSQTSLTAMELLPMGSNYLPIGLGHDRQFFWVDLSKTAHLLVGGTTGGGKSNLLNALLCSLISNNNPQQVQICGIDMKRVELWPYRRVPHLWRPIVTSYGAVAPLLEDIRTEMEARYQLLVENDMRNAEAWNAAHEGDPDKQLSRLVIFFDEMADVMLDSEFGKEVTSILERLTAMTRAVNIHFVLCTQRPQVSVVSGLIKGNAPARVAFNCADGHSSRVILDYEDAVGLSPAGRAIYSEHGHRYQVQTPLIEDKQITQTINRSIEAHRPALTPLRFWRMVAKQEPRTLADAWKLVKKERGAELGWVEGEVATWQYVPRLRGPVLLLDGQPYLCWGVRLVAAPPAARLPRTMEELQILTELGGNDG